MQFHALQKVLSDKSSECERYTRKFLLVHSRAATIVFLQCV